MNVASSYKERYWTRLILPSISVCMYIFPFSPVQYLFSIFRIFSAIILKITFDMDVSDMDHEYMQIAVEAIKGQSEAQMPGKFWVDFFPTLKYMPRWIPGAHFKQFLHHYNALTEKMLNLPFDATQRDIVRVLSCKCRCFIFILSEGSTPCRNVVPCDSD